MAPRVQNVYVLKQKYNNVFLTTHIVDKGKPGVVGFTTARQAYTMRKLMNYKVYVEKFEKDHMVRLCHTNCLDFVCYSSSGNIEVFDKPEVTDVDQFRFLLETTFRYY